MVGPVIEALSAEYSGKAAFGKMNVDENQVVPSSFGIMSIPTIIIFNHGKEVERLVGAYPKAHIEAMIKRICWQCNHLEEAGHDRTKKRSPNFLPRKTGSLW